MRSPKDHSTAIAHTKEEHMNEERGGKNTQTANDLPPNRTGLTPLEPELWNQSTPQLAGAHRRHRSSYPYNLCLAVSVLCWRYVRFLGAGRDAVIENIGKSKYASLRPI
jgi:hypothetical protein